jgi:hypothetical protein
MDLTADDKQKMKLNRRHIPSPAVDDRFSSCFHVSIGNDIAYEGDLVMLLAHALQVFCSFCHLLENEKLLLILTDKDGVSIYLDRLPAISTSIQRNLPIKRLNREKLSQDVLFAFDETRRALVVCASKKVPRCLLHSLSIIHRP